MMCFNVRKRGETYIAFALSSVMYTIPPDESIAPDMALFGEGLTALNAISDLCIKLGREHLAALKKAQRGPAR